MKNTPELAKVFCVTKDEYDLIEDFIIYYGEIFGYNNVIIIDNMSTNEHVLQVYERYKPKGVTVTQWESYEKGEQGRAFTTVMNTYKDTCEFLIGLDTDEIMVLRSVVEKNKPVHRSDLVDFLKRLPLDCTKFTIKQYYLSIADPTCLSYIDFKHTRPFREQHTFLPEYHRNGIKVFYRSSAFSETENGNHNGKVTHGNTLSVDELCYLHFHETGEKRKFERAETVVYGYKYITPQLTVLQRLSKLLPLRYEHARCHHAGFHRVEQYTEFICRRLVVGLFIKYIKRLPEENELHHHALRMCSKGYPFIAREFIHSSEAFVNKSLAEPQVEETMIDAVVFQEQPLSCFNNLVRCNSVAAFIAGFQNRF
jgi:hypothetical protein